MNRDELARHLYIHAHDDEHGDAPECGIREQEWDAGLVISEDVDYGYARADQMIASGEVTQ